MKVLKSPAELLQEFAKDNYTIIAKVTGYIYFAHPDGSSPEYPDFTPDMFEYCGNDVKYSYHTFKDNWLKEIAVKTKMIVKSPDELIKVFEREGYKPLYEGDGKIYFDKPRSNEPAFVTSMFDYCGKEPPYESYQWKDSWLKEIEVEE